MKSERQRVVEYDNASPGTGGLEQIEEALGGRPSVVDTNDDLDVRPLCEITKTLNDMTCAGVFYESDGCA